MGMKERGARGKVGGQLFCCGGLWHSMNHYFLSAHLRHMKVSKKRPVVISFPQLFSLFCSKSRAVLEMFARLIGLVSDYGSEGLEKNGKTKTKTILDDLKMPKVEEIFPTVAIVCHRCERLAVLLWKCVRDYCALNK